MKTDFLLAITQLAAERNLPKDVVFSAVEAALATAFKKDELGARQNISVKIHPASGDVKVYTTKVVVEKPEDPFQEISVEEAQRFKQDAQVDELITVETTDFHSGRIAAQTAKQVVLQRLREAEREFIFGEYINREGDVVSGVVQRIEPRQIVVDLGKTEGIIPGGEQVRNERYRVGQRIKLYLLEVNRGNRGPRLILSRSHPHLVRRLFELEVPEVFNGNVEIKAVAREPGYRSKVAVAAKQEGLDPVGSCVGLRGVRIQNVVTELNGERIDVIQWDDDPNRFIANALSPAQVVSVDVGVDDNTAVVVVPDGQLSLAIGKEGQNARLAARISGWRIDIKSVSAVEADRAAMVGAAAAAKGEAAPEEMVTADRPDLYDVLLEEVGLPRRALALLAGGGIEKVGHVLEKGDKELLAVKGFGPKTLQDVKEGLRAFIERVGEVEVAVGAEPAEVGGVSEELAEVAPEVEAEGEEVLEEGVMEEEEEVVVLYKAPQPELEAKPQIRFAEDIFPERAAVASVAGGKRGKKKKSRDDRADEAKQKKAKKVRAVTLDTGSVEEELDFAE
jgi:N utilization substance protein A